MTGRQQHLELLSHLLPQLREEVVGLAGQVQEEVQRDDVVDVARRLFRWQRRGEPPQDLARVRLARAVLAQLPREQLRLVVVTQVRLQIAVELPHITHRRPATNAQRIKRKETKA